MGNTPKVALRHYLMTTDTHFDAAVRGDEEALQNALQQSHAMGRLEPQPHDPIKKEAPVCRGLRVVAFERNPLKWRGQDSNL